jgi:hypothetical protein
MNFQTSFPACLGLIPSIPNSMNFVRLQLAGPGRADDVAFVVFLCGVDSVGLFNIGDGFSSRKIVSHVNVLCVRRVEH